MNLQTFEIEWKGRSLGGFTLADIRARLAAGELSRLHRVHAEDGWRPLGEWLDQLEANQRGARSLEQSRMERELDAERNRAAVLEDRLQVVERRAQTPAPAPWTPGNPPDSVPPPFHREELPQVSGLAVASLVFGILSGVLFCFAVVLVSERLPRWLGLCGWGITICTALAILHGHLALVTMQRDDSLRGRGMAMSGLITAYAVLGVLTAGIILGTLDDYRPFTR